MPVLLALLATLTISSPVNAQWLTEDFKIVIAETIGAPVRAKYDCRARIPNLLCLVNPPDAANQKRDCLPGSDKYITPFQDLYDVYPEHLQKMFCHLSVIYIEKDFIGSAYAGVIRDKQNATKTSGGILGIRESLLDPSISLSKWASWKEQVHFGIDPTRIAPRPDLPHIFSNARRSTDLLYFLVAHEFAHIFDFVNTLNDTEACNTGNCPIKSGTWGELSFSKRREPKREDDFPLRPRLCFYFCSGRFLPADLQKEIIFDLNKTRFLTTYATRYPEEDFAESFALYHLAFNRKATYLVRTGDGFVMDVVGRLKSDTLRSKRDYIEAFLKSRFRYP